VKVSENAEVEVNTAKQEEAKVTAPSAVDSAEEQAEYQGGGSVTEAKVGLAIHSSRWEMLVAGRLGGSTCYCY